MANTRLIVLYQLPCIRAVRVHEPDVTDSLSPRQVCVDTVYKIVFPSGEAFISVIDLSCIDLHRKAAFGHKGETVSRPATSKNKIRRIIDLFRVWTVATTVVATIASTTQVGSSEDHKLAFKIVIHAFS